MRQQGLLREKLLQGLEGKSDMALRRGRDGTDLLMLPLLSASLLQRHWHC